jgi:uncharacterized protein YqgQ
MSLLDDEIQLKRLRLKLAINKHLKRWGKDYANVIYHQLRCDDPTFFNSVLNEMCTDGMFTKEDGRNGALILTYQEVSHASNLDH